jgi:hypothetical protein
MTELQWLIIPAVANGSQRPMHFLKYWHPFFIPLTLAASRVLTKARYSQYPWPVLASDLCYFGVSFYIWATTAQLSNIKVCPPRNPVSGGEGTYVLFFLLVNFCCSMWFYPINPNVSATEMTIEIFVALLLAIGSPIFLRARW